MNNKLIFIYMIGLLQLFNHTAQAGTVLKNELATNTWLAPPPPDSVIVDTISIVNGDIITRCFSSTQLAGPIDTIYFCDSSPHSGEIVSFVPHPLTNCVKYRGISCGVDTACFVVCDALSNCDTIGLVVAALDPGCFPAKDFFYDTLFINTDRDYCLDLSELSGTPTRMINDCPDKSGNSIIFNLDQDSYCVNYSAYELGTDTACIIVMDDRGFADTTCMIITGKTTTPELICDTIEVGEQRLICLVNEELNGDIVSMTNFCPDQSGTHASFSLNTSNLCITVEGLTVGTDSACVVICDDLDICDTTYVKIVVTEKEEPTDTCIIKAIDDFATTPKNTPFTINVLGNDSLCAATPVILEVSQNGLHGSTIVNNDFTVDYIPDRNFCGLDSFDYRVCTPAACDTARVYVTVDCVGDTIIIYNGISPDGDGQNDVFTIKNIEDYPDNVVLVYNRWGNRVFQSQGYRNTWAGTWQGKDLPDGTYFYLIDLKDGRTFTGFLQIQR